MKQIKRIKKKYQIKNEQVAKICEVSLDTAKKWSCGDRNCPDAQIKKIEKYFADVAPSTQYLEMRLSDLLSEAEKMYGLKSAVTRAKNKLKGEKTNDKIIHVARCLISSCKGKVCQSSVYWRAYNALAKCFKELISDCEKMKSETKIKLDEKKADLK